ncbi:sulfatase-like hydrolase/transferase [Colwellia demingiae]|uniref:Sulfatase-like hydrolase/transferase n=1 Tax=Colwellia demingiae TaxID=89401 RepID=A0A5C6QGH5_9GAMM|nr:sulfatase-like hydrolase/transferase [Colwellia demingiae]TWX68084.1 sulfatase-like hydrolase/transferase [Colwellia demingiae]
MKKIIIILLSLLAIGIFTYQQRLNITMLLAPIARDYQYPVGPNIDINWSQGPEQAKNSPVQRKPNIVLIVADDMGFNDISLYNKDMTRVIETPNIDAIAHQGVQFNNGYAGAAICAPSRASMLTGRYSTRFGFEYTPIFKVGVKILNWIEELEPSPIPTLVDTATSKTLLNIELLSMPASEFTIAELLNQEDYYTAHIGKWHVGLTPQIQGFDDSLMLNGSLYMPKDDENVVNAPVEASGLDNMVWAAGQYSAKFNDGEAFSPKGYLTDYYTDEAVKVIEKNKNRPFYLELDHWGIHNPLQASKADYDALSHIKDHKLRVYSAMIRALDRSVAKVIQALADNGLTDNTLVIFTSDNGGAGYIDLPDINKPYRGWKITNFEGGIHIPFMAKWPAKIPAGITYDKAVHHSDIFQTIAAAAGASAPAHIKLDGVDFLPYILNENTGTPHETLFWRQGHQQSVLHKGWKLIRAEQPNFPDAPPMKFLFNLTNDPTEQNNLALVQHEKVTELEVLLVSHNAEQVAPLWPSVVNVPIMIDKSGEIRHKYKKGDKYLYWQN